MQMNPHRRTARAAAATLAATAALMLVGVSAASAAVAQTGPATLIDPATNKPLTTGPFGSAFTYSIRVPAGSACTKDTANNAYHVYGYIVPSTVDPGTLTFSSTGPSAGFPLTDSTGTPYSNASTLPTSGVVNTPPNMDFFSYTIDGRPAPDGTPAHTLPAGTYNIGVACATNLGALDKFWNAQIVTTAAPSDPNGFTYSALPTQVVPESPFAVALPLSAVTVAALGFFVVRRRRQHDAPVAA